MGGGFLLLLYWQTQGDDTTPIVLETALAAAIKGDATLTALVGARVYPLFLPESAALPAIYYRLVTRPRIHVLDGSAGLARPRVQFGCCSRSYADLPAMQAALRNIFDGFQGDLGNVRINAAQQIGEVDFYEDPASGSDLGQYHRAVDYRFDHREPVATPAASFTGSESDLESALVAALKGESTITDLIGERLFPLHIPESAALPAAYYSLMGRTHEQTLAGSAGLAQAQFRVCFLSRTYEDVAVLAELVRLLFQGFSGALSAVHVNAALATNETDSLIWSADGSDQQKFERSSDFVFLHREPIPSF